MSEGTETASATKPEPEPARPRANRAQIFQAVFASAQAALTLGILVIGTYGIYYNVLPTWELKTAQEEAARLGHESADPLKLGIEQSKGELARLSRDLTSNSEALAIYQNVTRRYVIDQFTTKLIGQVTTDQLWGLSPFTFEAVVRDRTSFQPIQ